jgi:hypothetical protein
MTVTLMPNGEAAKSGVSIPVPNERRCCLCREFLPLEMFSKTDPRCRPCNRLRRREEAERIRAGAGASGRKRSIAERFWSKVIKADGDGCWLWNAGRDVKGYGNFAGRHAHRVAYELTYGPLPEGVFACHRCDNPPCVRPDHLFPGDTTANVRDAIQKGRFDTPARRIAALANLALTPSHRRRANA